MSPGHSPSLDLTVTKRPGSDCFFLLTYVGGLDILGSMRPWPSDRDALGGDRIRPGGHPGVRSDGFWPRPAGECVSPDDGSTGTREALLAWLLDAAGVSASYPAPAAADAVRRRDERGSFPFAIDRGAAGAEVPVPGDDQVADVPTGGTLRLAPGAVAVVREDR